MLRDFTKESFDIIIQAGQSNSSGTGFGPVDKPYCPNENVWFMNENDTISLAVEKVVDNGIRSNFGVYFANEYINAGKLENGRKILILRAAVGGTGFLDNRWKPKDDLFLHMMEMIRTALALNPENRLVALLWHQGETDAICKATYEQHYSHLSTLLSLVRTTYNVPELPFIAGDFVQQWKLANIEICTPVVDAMRAFCRDTDYCEFVESLGLESNAQACLDPILGKQNDTIHFSRASLIELSRRYFEKFILITDQI